jgi:2-aminoadipate transaminase
MDLCTSPFTQLWLAEYMAAGKLEEVVGKTRALYQKKRGYMLEQLERHMPARGDLSWTKPEGGLFLWLSLPAAINADELLYKAIEKKVAYVSGSAYYFDNPEHNSKRINFSYTSLEQIEEGIRRLALVIGEALE